MGDFQQSIAFVLQKEGGYVNNPNDPGGETKYGIAKASHPNVDIANLTREQATQIYYKEYWLPIGGDALPQPIALVVFDSAVNVGVTRALQWLDESGGNVDTYLSLRQQYYEDLASANPRLDQFLTGWTARVQSLADTVRGYLQRRRSGDRPSGP
jgi:hypothetical protein